MLYIVNLILNGYKLLYMGCEFCYFYFLNIIHENWTHIIYIYIYIYLTWIFLVKKLKIYFLLLF